MLDEMHSEVSMETITCRGGQSRNNHERTLRLLITKEEVQKALADRKQLYLVRQGWQLRSCAYLPVRVNGALKEWKTRPTEWDLPCKYGFRECFHVTHRHTLTEGMLAVEVEPTE
jgi:hypothetical protein